MSGLEMACGRGGPSGALSRSSLGSAFIFPQLWAVRQPFLLQLFPVLSTARLGAGSIDRGGSLQRWVLGCMGFALDLFWGFPPIFHLHIKSLSS